MKWILVALLLLAACGGGVAPPDDLPPGYTITRGNRVGLALPDAWVAMQPTVEDYREMVERVSEIEEADQPA